MANDSSLAAADQITLCTVRLTVPVESARERHGTGILYMCRTEKLNVPVIITNRHVLDGATEVEFSLTTADATGRPKLASYETFTMAGIPNAMISHPDPEVDLAAIPMAPALEIFKAKGDAVANRMLTADVFLGDEEERDLTAIEEVVTVGYPDGRWDRVNNRPIARRGITATHAAIDYNGKREFLIDAACFPGTSGSPVFLRLEGTFEFRDDLPLIQERYRLLGVLSEAPLRVERATLRNVFPTAESGAEADYELPLHLGTVIKTSRIRELEVAAIMEAERSVR